MRSSATSWEHGGVATLHLRPHPPMLQLSRGVDVPEHTKSNMRLCFCSMPADSLQRSAASAAFLPHTPRDLGSVNTEHHHVSLAVKSILDCMEEDEEGVAEGEAEVGDVWGMRTSP